MSERERIKQVIDRLPEYKLAYVSNLILSIEKTDIEEAEPDEYNDCGSKKIQRWFSGHSGRTLRKRVTDICRVIKLFLKKKRKSSLTSRIKVNV